MYNHLFLDELEKMCTTSQDPDIFMKHFSSLQNRRKRFVSILVGILIISIVTISAVAIAGVTQSTINSGRIEDMRSELNRQNANVKHLMDNDRLMTVAIRNLQMDYNKLLGDLDSHMTDYSELKSKQISANFIISYITHRFLTGKLLIQEAFREWKDRKVFAPLLDFLNITLPCGTDCPLKYATPRFCSMNSIRDTVVMSFNVPVINSTMHLMEADPFTFMMKTNNKTCRVEYDGPHDIIASTSGKCILGVNVNPPNKKNLLLAPGTTCTGEPDFSKNKYFDVKQCDNQTPGDHKKFVQLKPYGDSVFIYCPNSTMEMAGNKKTCSNEVYEIPISSTFKINDQEYKGSSLYSDHIVKVDSSFQANLHWLIHPKVVFSEHRQHPLAIEDLHEIEEVGLNYVSHPMTWTTVTLVSLLLIAAVAVAIIWYIRRRRGIMHPYQAIKQREPTVSAHRGPEGNIQVNIEA